MVRVPTNSQVNRAGQSIRKFLVEAEPWSEDRLRSAYEVLVVFRAAHQYPLIKTNMGLRSVLRTAECQVEVAQ
ncbi:MAG: hypothetical protein ACYCYK_10510 [Candidatus Dormibacteria bacterium]